MSCLGLLRMSCYVVRQSRAYGVSCIYIGLQKSFTEDNGKSIIFLAHYVLSGVVIWDTHGGGDGDAYGGGDRDACGGGDWGPIDTVRTSTIKSSCRLRLWLLLPTPVAWQQPLYHGNTLHHPPPVILFSSILWVSEKSSIIKLFLKKIELQIHHEGSESFYLKPRMMTLIVLHHHHHH